jgi:predicted component of type VI protein secretion system
MQGNDNFRLVVRRGPQPNQTYDLNKDIITVGRDITNDITINDPEVSRHHMRFTRGAGGFTLEDLGSTNGTFVNGQRLTGAKPLNNGDMIGLGETVTLGYELVRPAGVGQQTASSVGPEMAPTAPNPIPRQPVQPAPQPVAPPAPVMSYEYNPAPAQPAYSPAPPVAPPGAGYDYDPYAVREEEPRNTTRWILIGCAAISIFCCCGTVVSLWLVDTLCLWDKLPVVSNVISALGYVSNCAR